MSLQSHAPSFPPTGLAPPCTHASPPPQLRHAVFTPGWDTVSLGEFSALRELEESGLFTYMPCQLLLSSTTQRSLTPRLMLTGQWSSFFFPSCQYKFMHNMSAPRHSQMLPCLPIAPPHPCQSSPTGSQMKQCSYAQAICLHTPIFTTTFRPLGYQ